MLKPVTTDIEALKTLDERLRWLSAWTIHHANHIRENADGLKVGGHQASCASMTAIMAALYFGALRPNDRVAVKPHAGPVLHAIHYLLGHQSLDQLQRFRALGGAQSYPSIDKAALTSLISFAALMLLFIFNFHHEIIRALVDSYRIAPVTVPFRPQAALVDLTDTLSASFFVMLRIGSPFVAYGLLVNITIGFVNKLVPQIPVYFISLPFVITGGLFILYFSIGTMLSLIVDSFVPVTLGH